MSQWRESRERHKAVFTKIREREKEHNNEPFHYSHQSHFRSLNAWNDEGILRGTCSDEHTDICVEWHGYSVWRANHPTHKNSYARAVLFSPNRLMVKPSKWIKDLSKKDLKNQKFDGFAETEPLNLPTPLKQCNESWYQIKQAWQFGNGPFEMSFETKDKWKTICQWVTCSVNRKVSVLRAASMLETKVQVCAVHLRQWTSLK